MFPKQLVLSVLFLSFFFSIHAQNYLRVSDPDAWGAPVSSEPDWHLYAAHAMLDEVTIVAEPQGVFTEIGFYATISQGPDMWAWSGEYEIIWQFELPGNAIVHDSWLWVNDIIVKAEVLDFWTALQTYEDIVDRNRDPSFFYRMADNRYEIRIYPLFEGESRRIKMSFLVPAAWDAETVTTGLLQNLLQGTQYSPPMVSVRMPVDDLWQAPKLKMDNSKIPFLDTVVGGTGDLLHYLEIDGEDFTWADDMGLILQAPYTGDNTFVSTYSEGGDNFYQLAYFPDWEQEVQDVEAHKTLVLLDYDDSKTSVIKTSLITQIQFAFEAHFSDLDAINVAVATTDGIKFLSDNWWDFDADAFAGAIADLIEAQNTVDFELLLSEGFSWAQSQGDVDRIVLMAANDNFVYPPVADGVFSDLEPSIPANIPLTLLDYQDENVSVIFYNNEEYHGNGYFYQMLANAFDEAEVIVFRDQNSAFPDVAQQIFPAFEIPTGIMDYSTTLQNGVGYQRYSINSPFVTAENNGVILQTGKYLGDFPMDIEASFITDDGGYWTVSHTVMPDEIVVGDTLMREMWYGPHLNYLETQLGSDEDRLFLIEESINERVLTGLTAFLALDPSEGGEPCIDCLFNNGGGIIISTEEPFNPAEADLLATPNPATDFTLIRLEYTEILNPSDWTATIYDVSGRAVAYLDTAVSNGTALEWRWEFGKEIRAGVYYCTVQSGAGSLVAKVVVMHE